MIDIRNAEPRDLDDLSAFSAIYNRAGSSTFQRDFFDWQFVQAQQLCRAEDNGALLAKVDDKIVGMSIAGKVPVQIGGAVSTGVWHQEWYAAPEHGGAGLALVLEQSARNDFIGCGGRSFASVNVFNRLRPTVWFEIPRLFAVVDETKTYEMLFSKSEESRRYLSLQTIDSPSSSLRGTSLDEFDERYDGDWLSFRKSAWLSNDRTSAYMNWRYNAHPRFTYLTLRTDSPFGSAYFVWRNEEVAEYDTVVTRLCDAIGSPKAIISGFPMFFERLRDSACALVDFFCSHAVTLSALVEAGMRPQVTTAEFELPRLFQPLARDPRKTINFGYSLPRDRIPDQFYRIDGTYITKSDSNQDRPNP